MSVPDNAVHDDRGGERPPLPSLTPEEYEKGLTRALRGFTGADERWAERRARGLTDEELRAAIGYEFGIMAGWCGPDSSWWGETHGGENPRFKLYIPRFPGEHVGAKLAGKALVDAVRALEKIPLRDAAGAVQPDLFA